MHAQAGMETEMSDARRKLGVFPAFHKVAGRPVLVVGEGGEAVAKVRLLGETEALIRIVWRKLSTPKTPISIRSPGPSRYSASAFPRALSALKFGCSAPLVHSVSLDCIWSSESGTGRERMRLRYPSQVSGSST